MFSLNFNNWSASSELTSKNTLGDYGSKDLLTDRVEYFFLIVPAEQLMDSRQMFGDGLL